ncbi:MAG: hypothetical protein F4X04_01570 [Holophagales bacterium]|nr:hypothetical protein [Holophagales bacterium]
MGSRAAALVREATDIVQLIEEVTEVTRSGADAAMAICPFHADKDTPSLSISSDKGVYNCFGCGARGDALTFVQQQHGVGFTEALSMLATRSGIDLGPQTARQSRAARLDNIRWQAAEFYHALLRVDHAAAPTRAYLRRAHGFGSADVTGFTVGWAPPDPSAVTSALRDAGASGRDIAASGVANLGMGRGGRVVYPVVTGPERVAGFVSEDSSGRTFPPHRGSRLLFGMGQARSAIAREGTAVVVPDVAATIAWHRVGVANTVAPATARLNTDQLATLARFGSRAVVVSPDPDSTRTLLADTPSVSGIDVYIGEAHRVAGVELSQAEALAAARSAVPIPEARLTAALDGYRTAATPTTRRALVANARQLIEDEADERTRWELAAVAAGITGLPVERVMGAPTLLTLEETTRRPPARAALAL